MSPVYRKSGSFGRCCAHLVVSSVSIYGKELPYGVALPKLAKLLHHHEVPPNAGLCSRAPLYGHAH